MDSLLKKTNAAKGWALLSAVLTLAVAIAGIYFYPSTQQTFDSAWLPALGSRFTLSMDGMSKMLVLLTAISFPLIFLATYKTAGNYKNAGSFYALMLLTQAGLMGVFVANDALLFYFFWELALIPVYFLCSSVGRRKKNCRYFQILYLYIHWVIDDAGRNSVRIFPDC